MIPLVAIGGCGVALLVLYMRRPPVDRLRISAARFLSGTELRTHQPKRLSVTAPMRRWRFWLRMAMLALLAAALWTVRLPTPFPSDARVGLLVVVDTSYSMTTRSGSGSRFEEALGVLRQVEQSLDALPAEVPVCTAIYAADTQARRVGDLSGALSQLSEVGPNPRGGSAAGLRRLASFEPADCEPTQVVVVTDLSQPVIERSGQYSAPVAWLRVGQPMPNAGIRQVAANNGGLDRGLSRVYVDVVSDPSLGEPGVSVSGPDGGTLATEEVEIDADDIRRFAFEPQVAGSYEVTLGDGGAYSGDDRVRVGLELGGRLRVNWQVPVPMPKLSGWVSTDETNADLLVAPLAASGSAPLSLRTAGTHRGQADTKVGFFIEGHPLLENVSLDVFERHAPEPADELPDDYKGVLTSTGGAPWIAVRDQPRSVIVPSLAAGRSEALRNLSATVFFNALRWLMQSEVQVLESDWLTPRGEMIEDGRNESTPAAKGTQAEPPEIDIARKSGRKEDPLWPWLVLAAILLGLGERVWTLTQRGRA